MISLTSLIIESGDGSIDRAEWVKWKTLPFIHGCYYSMSLNPILFLLSYVSTLSVWGNILRKYQILQVKHHTIFSLHSWASFLLLTIYGNHIHPPTATVSCLLHTCLDHHNPPSLNFSLIDTTPSKVLIVIFVTRSSKNLPQIHNNILIYMISILLSILYWLTNIEILYNIACLIATL